MTKRYHHNWDSIPRALPPRYFVYFLNFFFFFFFFPQLIYSVLFFSRYIGSRLIANFGTFYLPFYPTPHKSWIIPFGKSGMPWIRLSFTYCRSCLRTFLYNPAPLYVFSLFSCNVAMKAVVLCHIHRNHARALFFGFCYALACSIAAAAISPCYMPSCCCLQGVIAAGRFLELGTIILRIPLLTGIIFSFLQHPICIAQILNCHYRKYSANNISEVCSL
jgi:hypothetical protein